MLLNRHLNRYVDFAIANDGEDWSYYFIRTFIRTLKNEASYLNVILIILVSDLLYI